MAEKWTIRKNASQWECDWSGDARFHLQRFRALPMEKKIQAVEEMCALAATLKEQRGAYRTKRKRKSTQ